MNTQRTIPQLPGTYRFKPAAFLPWVPVRVIKNDIQSQSLAVRCAGFTFPVKGLFAQGYWQAA